jgi:outer membrane protein assembly factor BamB
VHEKLPTDYKLCIVLQSPKLPPLWQLAACGKRSKFAKGTVMKTSDLVFVGIKGSVVALNRATGKQVWVRRLKGSGFVNVVLDAGKVLATTSGEIFCVDPTTGQPIWYNPLKGFGFGLATIATESAPQGNITSAMAEKLRQDEEAAAAAVVVAT